MVYLSLKIILGVVTAASLTQMATCLLPSSLFGMAAGASSSNRFSSNKFIFRTTPGRTTFSSLPMVSEDDIQQDIYASVHVRIQELVDTHPVLLFMKGTKLFPQCGFSNTASQILHSFNIEFHAVDVLADEAIRQGVKEFSSWPTIPQLYVGGEFIGGSDIMIEMYQSGELGELIEKVLADKVE
jgi:monothiol glutaredoxin